MYGYEYVYKDPTASKPKTEPKDLRVSLASPSEGTRNPYTRRPKVLGPCVTQPLSVKVVYGTTASVPFFLSRYSVASRSLLFYIHTVILTIMLHEDLGLRFQGNT